MSRFEVLKPSESRVSRKIYKSLKYVSKVGLIFVHICLGLEHTRTKICRSFCIILGIAHAFFYCPETLVYFLFCVVCLDSNAAAYMDENLANFFTA